MKAIISSSGRGSSYRLGDMFYVFYRRFKFFCNIFYTFCRSIVEGSLRTRISLHTDCFTVIAVQLTNKDLDLMAGSLAIPWSSQYVFVIQAEKSNWFVKAAFWLYVEICHIMTFSAYGFQFPQVNFFSDFFLYVSYKAQWHSVFTHRYIESPWSLIARTDCTQCGLPNP